MDYGNSGIVSSLTCGISVTLTEILSRVPNDSDVKGLCLDLILFDY